MNREVESAAPRRPIGRLGQRLLGAFLFVSLVPLAVTAGLGFLQSRAVVERFVAENVGKTARVYAADLDTFLERQRALLRGLDAVGAPTDEALAAYVAGAPHLEALALLDDAGQWVAGSQEPAGFAGWPMEACQALLGAPDQAMTHSGEGHAHEVIVAIPHDGPGGGVLCGQVTFTLHQDLLSERARSAVEGTAYIVDRSGRVVCHAFEEHEPHVGRGDHLGGHAAEHAARATLWSGRLPGASDDGGGLFAAYAPARTLPWGVWVEVPESVAAASLQPLLGRSLIYALLSALLVTGAALLLVRRLVGPLQDLAGAARAIASGRYGETLSIPGSGPREDEVAELAREFNRMSLALKESYARLDERVAQRTRELQSAQEFSDRLLDTIQERVLVIDRGLNVVRANRAARTAYGDEIVGCDCRQIHGTPAGERCPAERVFETGGPLNEERRSERGGRAEILSVDTYPLEGPGGVPEAALEIARDITERRQMQARLMHQEKMAALGTLAAGLAHEIGNPLASLSSELEMLEMDWDPGDARASLPVLREQIQRISKLLRELIEFGRHPRDETAPLDAGALVGDVIRLLRHDPRSRGVTIQADVAESTRQICTNRDRLLQVLLNLGLNALDALEGSGQLLFRVRLEGEGEVRFQVVDDGPGVAAEVAERVFEPFFTTKPPGRGTGLGLFVSERVADQLGGRLEFRPGEGEGASFSLVLPTYEWGSEPAEPAESAEESV